MQKDLLLTVISVKKDVTWLETDVLNVENDLELLEKFEPLTSRINNRARLTFLQNII